MRTAWFFVALVSSFVLAIAHTIASAEYLYWTYRWLDIPMHLLGGFALASFIIAMMYRKRLIPFWILVLVVGVGWEIFEVVIGTPRPYDYVFDTAKDLANDGIGALIAYSLARITLWRSA